MRNECSDLSMFVSIWIDGQALNILECDPYDVFRQGAFIAPSVVTLIVPCIPDATIVVLILVAVEPQECIG